MNAGKNNTKHQVTLANHVKVNAQVVIMQSNAKIALQVIFLKFKKCLQCDEVCSDCSLKSNNCSSCKNDFYLIKGGEYEINCVENCPNDTVKYEENKTCLYVERNNTNPDEQGDNEPNELDLFFWGFILGIAFLLLLLNIIFFCRFCCCKKGEDNIYKQIQTELSEDLVIN